MTTAIMRRYPRAALAIVAAVTTACGGGGDDPTPPRTRFELRPASPAEHVGRLDAAPDSGASLDLRAPDGLSAVPYCLLRYTGLRHANGSSYLMGVAFGVVEKRVLVVTLSNRETSWHVAAFNPPAAEAVIEPRERRLTLRSLRSTQGMQVGWEATLSGQAAIPAAAAGSGACD